jgi:hypothetical protein
MTQMSVWGWLCLVIFSILRLKRHIMKQFAEDTHKCCYQRMIILEIYLNVILATCQLEKRQCWQLVKFVSCLLNQMAKWGLFYLQYWTKDIGLQVNTSISQKNKIKQKKLGIFENEIQYYFHFVLSNAVILSIGCIWINCITSLQRATV